MEIRSLHQDHQQLHKQGTRHSLIHYHIFIFYVYFLLDLLDSGVRAQVRAWIRPTFRLQVAR